MTEHDKILKAMGYKTHPVHGKTFSSPFNANRSLTRMGATKQAKLGKTTYYSHPTAGSFQLRGNKVVQDTVKQPAQPKSNKSSVNIAQRLARATGKPMRLSE